jgi:hypothetical protein
MREVFRCRAQSLEGGKAIGQGGNRVLRVLCEQLTK